MRKASPALATLLLVASTVPAVAAPTRPADLLPNLVALPARNAATGGVAGGCQPVETVEQGARRCLRFDQVIANYGEGPFEIRYGVETLATTQQLRQRIYRSDGSHRDRVAEQYEFHAAHLHFHYKGFGVTHLWASDTRGRLLGHGPLRSGRKNGFCVIDVENHWAGQPESIDDPRYQEPQCQLPSSFDGQAIEMVQGISRGWADVYGYQIEGQYVEITGIPDGFYVLEHVADPDNTVREAKERDNRARSHVQLCQNGEFVQLHPPPPGLDFCSSPS